MAVYKVPQDVEAEDKLVGPFGFRQFVYLGIAAGSGFIGYLLFQIHPLLIIIPLPVIFFFIVLALPLRKEQPMETYLLALLRFYLKPKMRKWNPDGTISYVEIVTPPVIEQKLSKSFTGETATERLDYLARVMDSRGWALKGQSTPAASLNANVAAEAATVTDVLDEDAALAQRFATKIAQKDRERREQAVAQMHQVTPEPPSQSSQQPQTTASTAKDGDEDADAAALQFNPYPTSMHQRVIRPLARSGQTPAKTTDTNAKKPKPKDKAMPPAVSPDIIRLANNDDLSISAIAREAHRLNGEDKEVVIKLH